jgi:hypothetical protein
MTDRADEDQFALEEFLSQEQKIEEALLENLGQLQSRESQDTSMAQVAVSSPPRDPCSLYSDVDYDDIFMDLACRSDDVGQPRHGQDMDMSSG